MRKIYALIGILLLIIISFYIYNEKQSIINLTEKLNFEKKSNEKFEVRNKNLEEELEVLALELGKMESTSMALETEIALLEDEKTTIENEIIELRAKTDESKIKDFYEKEKDMYDSVDFVAIEFLKALEKKDIGKLNSLLSQDNKILIEEGSIVVDNGADYTVWLGDLAYETAGFTIHGFRYKEDVQMLIVYCQISYDEDGERVTPPTYIDLGFEIDGNFPSDLKIDWIQHDI